ncbi:MAG: PotD/PotF family extracellular solute-binding protein [Firmicutes bacterium]|nr:PotD/PotF family extracellular solute-binding protein [Bacillota bacterium]
MTKKTIAIICIAVLLIGGGLTTWLLIRVPRSQTLRIFIWDHFMAEGIENQFQRYWRDHTGRRFRVVIGTYSSNDDLRRALVNERADWDIIVPSDYMLERLVAENRVRPLNLSRIYNLTPTGTDSIVRNIAPEGETANWQFNPDVIDSRITGHIHRDTTAPVFGIPYLYGTMGVFIDNRINGLREAVEHYGWASLWAHDAELTPTWVSEFGVARNIQPSTKAIGRENYTLARLAMHRDELLTLNGQALADRLDELFGAAPQDGRETFQEELTEVLRFLQRMHPQRIFESGDQTLEEFYSSTNQHHMAFEWSVSAVYVMQYSNHRANFEYIIPEEGTNLWINNFAIPTNPHGHTRNVDAAYGFIEWMMRPENASRNMAWSGSSTPIIEAADELFYYFDNESTLFNNIPENRREEWKEMFLRAFFPMQFNDIMERAAVMRHFGENRDQMLETYLMYNFLLG